MGFAERYGYSKVKSAIQRESIDNELKTRLWSLLDIHLYSNYRKPFLFNRDTHNFLDQLIQNYWYKFLKESTDNIPINNLEKIKELKGIFFNKLSWFKIYDFMEFTIVELHKVNPEADILHKIKNELNNLLEEENSAYRLINLEIIEISAHLEIQSIEEALENTNQFSGVQQHLKQALQLMSDRQNPDYRNSIKESVSALEGLCQKILNKDKVTLGDAIGQIEKQYPIHPALKSSIKSLYGYTSDGDGIRHAMLEESNLSYIDAKFMLVACTNFINYLIEKTKDQN